jgi:membrane protein implicated in regulation of membrane protease activity
MPWWGWILVGTLLLGGEMLVDAAFYLVLLGVAALVVGLLDLSAPGWPLWLEWLAFAGVAGASTVVFRKRLYEKLHPGGDEVGNSVLGQTVVVREALAPGAAGQVELRGSVWSARNSDDQEIPAGGRARVDAVDGLVLELRAD